MKNNVVKAFADSTVNVLQTMTATKTEIGNPELKKGTVTFGVVTGVIGMAGTQSNGNLLLSFDENCILAIVSRLLMEEFLTINKDVIDAVGEMTNMICGGAKRALSEQGFTFEMASPMVLTGKNLELRQMSDTPVLTIPFHTPEGSFVIETNLGVGTDI